MSTEARSSAAPTVRPDMLDAASKSAFQKSTRGLRKFQQMREQPKSTKAVWILARRS